MIDVALLGAGSIGVIHAQNLHDHPAFRLRFVCDVDLGRAEELANRFGGSATTSPEEAVGSDGVDAVIVASSTVAHRDNVLLAARAGRAVLCEKPVADSLDDALDCMSAAADAGIVAAMGFNRRLDASYMMLQEQVAEGAIGQVEMMRIVSRSDIPPAPESAALSGGMIREKGAHFFDLACWIADADPVEVSAMGACLIDPGFADYGDIDTAAITLRLASGALIALEFGRRTNYGYDEMIEAFGSGGLAASDRQATPGISVLSGAHWSSPGLHASWRERFAATYVSELDSFAGAIRGEQPVHATLADGVRAQAVAEAVIEALRTGHVTPIEPVWR
jgi:myo-inositol 2-dehydrogenase/D-chiro-inositol 1-dehydrogenase